MRSIKHTDIKALICLLKELFEIEEDFVFEENKQSKGLGGCPGIEAVAREKDCVVLAEHVSGLIGMCTVQTLISTAEGGYVGLVEDMVVVNKYSGKGIGRQLILKIERRATSQGLTRL
ncbi:MAG: GNAT family N-acetyltransferase [Methylococcales bacterium]